MPTFFFDLSSVGSIRGSRDARGLDFLSIGDARAHAMTLLPVMSRDLPMNEGEFKSWKVIVRDDAGLIVCRLIMAIINDPLDPEDDRRLRPVGEKQ